MMNEQSTQYNFSENAVIMNPISSTLITMQIQALSESLRRLVEQDDLAEVELLGRELAEVQSKPNC